MFINAIYEQTCIIITTNKMAADWAKMLDYEVLSATLLDRLLFRFGIINLSVKNYRMKNRKPFIGSG
ncbi:MAG: ATP-binding protein [Anditalea sp.]